MPKDEKLYDSSGNTSAVKSEQIYVTSRYVSVGAMVDLMQGINTRFESNEDDMKSLVDHINELEKENVMLRRELKHAILLQRRG